MGLWIIKHCKYYILICSHCLIHGLTHDFACVAAAKRYAVLAEAQRESARRRAATRSNRRGLRSSNEEERGGRGVA